MSFTITQSDAGGLHFLQLTDRASGTYVKILTEHGALLQEFSIPLNSGRLKVISGYQDLADLLKHHSLFYRSAKLSPFPCRIKNGRYLFEGKTYEFKNKFTDGSAIHGLLFNSPFVLTAHHADELSAFVILEHQYRHADPGYPFDYQISVKYTLKKDGLLTLDTNLTNRSPGPIPIADGWHPYFSLGGKANDWLLTVNAHEILAFDEHLLPNGKKILFDSFSRPTRIGSMVFDHCFIPEFHPGKPVCELFNPANGASLSFYPDASYPYLQIYTPEDRNHIAIENLSAAPDCFNNGMGITILGPGRSQSFTARYQIGLQ
jgi:aldose 1-epimerase